MSRADDEDDTRSRSPSVPKTVLRNQQQQRTSYGDGDLLLHSLESDPRYGPSVQKYISKYLDENTFLNLSKNHQKMRNVSSNGSSSSIAAGRTLGDRSEHHASKASSSHEANQSHHLFLGRTIKAATRFIDAQGKKAGASSRFNSQSMINLSGVATGDDRIKLSTALSSLTDGRGMAGAASFGTTPSSSAVAAALVAASSANHSSEEVSLETANSSLSSSTLNVGPTAPSKSPSATGIRSIIESQLQQEKEALSPTLRSLDANKRKVKKKNIHKLRIQERDAKIQDLDSDASSNATVSIELKSQFNCLPARPIYQSSIDRASGMQSSSSVKSLTLQTPDCPIERIQFYKNISQVVRKGKKGATAANFVNNSSIQAGGFIELVFKQELRDLVWLEIQGFMDNRSMIEEDSFLCAQRKQIPIVLQKILKFSVVHQSRGRTVAAPVTVPPPPPSELMCTTPRSSPVTVQSGDNVPSSSGRKTGDMDQTPVAASETQNTDLRLLIDCDKLAASVALKLNLRDSLDHSHHHRRNTLSSDAGDTDGMSASADAAKTATSQSSEAGAAAGDPNHSQQTSIGCLSPAGEDENDCYCSETLSRLCQSCVEKENEALEQVDNMINELKAIERLYPCTKALAYDYPIYTSEAVNNRIKSLYLYVNITKDMRQKINLLAKLFQITDRSSAGWPDFDRDSSDDDDDVMRGSGMTDTDLASLEATPEVRAQDIYGYSYKLSAEAMMPKHVQFKQTASSVSSATISAPDSPDVNQNNNLTGQGSPSFYAATGCKEPNYFFASKTSIYRKYVDKSLKHRGLRNLYHQLSHILRPLLYRVHAALKKPSSITYAEALNTSIPWVTGVGGGTKPQWKQPLPISREYVKDLSTHGVWSSAYQEMGLPTFHRPFLFLLRVTVDVVHECLRLRLEQQPEQASAVSVSQLIRECKEVIKAGVQIRQRYVNLAQTVLGEGGTDAIEAQLDTFDDDLKTMLQVYLKYLEQYMFFMQQVSSQTSSTLRQKGYLEDEWKFVRNFCVHIPDGEQMAANKFCRMSSDLLISIGDYLSNGINECFQTFNESLAAAAKDMYGFRKGILRSCRNFKAVFHEASGRACQATAFAKSLRKDLEFAAEFKHDVSIDDLLIKLRQSGHIRIFSPSCSNYLMFVPNFMHGSESYIWQLVDLTCGGRGVESDVDTGGYLLVMACPADRDPVIPWTGATIVLEPTVESSISLSHVQVDGFLFVTNQPSNLEIQCRHFEQMMSGTVTLHKQPTSCNRIIAQALTDLKVEALDVQDKISHSLNLIYDQVDITRVSTGIEVYDANSLHARCLDICHLGFKFAFEYEKSLTRLITGDLKIRLSKQLITFALQWIKFVMNKCESGRAFRTRWSNQGLQYLIVALEPQYLVALDDDEYKFLKAETEKFLLFIKSCKDDQSPKLTPSVVNPVLANPCFINRPLASSLNFQRSQSVSSVKGMFGDSFYGDRQDGHHHQQHELPSQVGTRLEEWAQRRNSHRNLKKITENEPLVDEKAIIVTKADVKPLERAQKAIAKLEASRRKKLQDGGVIGDVSNLIIQRAPLQITARKVNFPWQRGFKIGEGRFGKVYTAVNNATGELIAMKEINLQSNDHRAIKETIDEIRTFEGIKHPNLVRYYGIEIHRSDLYIFMEYCNEGTLESAVQLNLPEQLVRKYTRQLLEAVNILHENGIVHRDIKSANIFLTSDGNLKLGDFGCCMKLKNQTTMVGELSAFVGTPAYMAPEIFTRNSVEGHGRAADIWSIGCVVLEMLTGRRPWHDLDNSYQIMFKVGMGESPDVPGDLCPEGLSFISRCLIHDPRLRMSTGQLLCHPFTKVLDDDDVDDDI